MGMFFRLQRERKDVRSKMYVSKISDTAKSSARQRAPIESRYILSGDVDLVNACNLTTFLGKQFKGDIFVKVFDLLMPFIPIETSTYIIS